MVRETDIGPGRWRRRSRSGWGLDRFVWGRSDPIGSVSVCYIDKQGRTHPDQNTVEPVKRPWRNRCHGERAVLSE